MRAYTAGLVACSLLLLCDAASGLLTINATPLSTRLTPGARRVAIEPPSSLAIEAQLDAGSGTVLRGTFTMTGDVDDYASQTEYSGVLLTGDIIEFSYFDLSSTDV